MTSISIIVPAYDMAAGVERTLRSLADEGDAAASDLEVIVVDDGSSDGTREVVAAARRRLPGLRYLFRARDPLSCRARARNLGIEAASGDLLLFLDAGVVLGPGYLPRLRALAARRPGAVVIGKTLGLFASAAAGRVLAGVASREDAAALVSRLSQAGEWQDVREPYAELHGAGGHVLPAPWLLAWTCALAVPRELAVSVGGFDHRYTAWGVEDVDFAARLHQAGAELVWSADTVAVHAPHVRDEARALTHAQNARALHAKLGTRETELFSVLCDGFAVNALAQRLDGLNLAALVPFYAAADLGRAAHDIQHPRGLCVGLRWSEALSGLRPAIVLAHNQTLAQRLAGAWPTGRIEPLVGCALPFGDGELEVAVLGDLVRLLPAALQRPQLRELGRVARRVVLLLATAGGHEQTYRALAGWGWSSIQELLTLARAEGLGAVAVMPVSDRVTRVVLEQAARAPASVKPAGSSAAAVEAAR